jgi:hypothetical protein
MRLGRRALSFGLTIAVAICAILCAAFLVYDLVRGYRRRGIVGLVLLATFLIALRLTTGFPVPSSGRIAFGGTISVGWAVLAMFVGVVLGMVAQYVWSKPEAFLWLDFLKPIVVSPMVLLPLIGSLSNGPLEPLQMFSLALLAFQNGYFWQQVLKDAKPKQA